MKVEYASSIDNCMFTKTLKVGICRRQNKPKITIKGRKECEKTTKEILHNIILYLWYILNKTNKQYHINFINKIYPTNNKILPFNTPPQVETS